MLCACRLFGAVLAHHSHLQRALSDHFIRGVCGVASDASCSQPIRARSRWAFAGGGGFLETELIMMINDNDNNSNNVNHSNHIVYNSNASTTTLLLYHVAVPEVEVQRLLGFRGPLASTSAARS